jgi:5'-3' exonuclease
MGVPGFFSWLIKNYKNTEFILSKINNKVNILYIDANCLFHPQCFKILDYYSNLKDVNKLENYMYKRIINYIDFLISYVNPEIVYISVDGVAPLAKISQQRKRRFKTIKDNLEKDKIKQKYNIPVNNIWSNVKITPGTQFMEDLHEQLLLYINEKSINNNIKYIYSSYHTVGEGEHKILKHIREKTNNETCVIYGLDADLFFLSMASEKDNIYLLRETNFLNTNIPKQELYDPIDDVYEELKYISIDITKSCYNKQIINIINTKLKNYNLNEIELNINNQRFINDFIFLCYLLGNDFLPHLPSINIKKNGLNFLLDVYSDIFVKTNTFLLHYNSKKKIKINYIILTEIFRQCAIKESYFFTNILQKETELNKKKTFPLEYTEYQKEIWKFENIKNIIIEDNIKLGIGNPNEWKFRYYYNYFKNLKHYKLENTKNINEISHLINNLCKNYMEGLKWVTKYYFEGCSSWLWQYKYTHAPFISDLYQYLNNNQEINIKFKKDKPITPCIQLLSVLPPNCYKELPKNYQKIILDEKSSIKYMFPNVESIEIDYINKTLLWECIPLIPYLNIEKIQNECIKYKLNKNELKLNKIYSDIIF